VQITTTNSIFQNSSLYAPVPLRLLLYHAFLQYVILFYFVYVPYISCLFLLFLVFLFLYISHLSCFCRAMFLIIGDRCSLFPDYQHAVLFISSLFIYFSILRPIYPVLRFICLIDTLYDHKIRLVASGEKPYWELFKVGSTLFCSVLFFLFLYSLMDH
jgi:hypothetical protein